jgi:hypothetical protein
MINTVYHWEKKALETVVFLYGEDKIRLIFKKLPLIDEEFT